MTPFIARSPRLKNLSASFAGMLFALCLAGPVLAQSNVLLVFAPADQHEVALPSYARDALAVQINLDVLATSQIGDSLQVQIAQQRFISLQINALTTYINGDKMLRAQGQDQGELYSLAVTVGKQDLFGHLSSAEGSVQIYAHGSDFSLPGSTVYSGWLYRPQGLSTDLSTLHNDYLIPDASRLPKPTSAPEIRLPLELVATSAQTNASAEAASTVGINSSNFKITQQFDRDSVLVGDTVTATLSFKNISNQTHTSLIAEVYFMLENSNLLSASPGCTQQLSLSLQKVLYCDLGNFAPGVEKKFNYQLGITNESRPLVISTPVVGSLRLDSFINVVQDVRTDSDGDGISDYNEILLQTDPFDPNSVDNSDTVIDVMAFYTPAAEAAYPFGVETRINQLISVANQVYADSGVGISLRPVYHGRVEYNGNGNMDSALDAIIYKTDPAFANVDKLRQVYGGDLVMLFSPLGAESSRCGLAPVGGFNTSGDFSAATEKQFAYAHIGIDCPADIVVAHELGHNMGLTHSQLEDGDGGTFDFSTGYGVDGQFATVMALPAAFHAQTRVSQFSNPRKLCLDFVCGVPADQAQPADAVLSLNIVRHQIANYFPRTVPDMPRNSIATLSGLPTTAQIAIAASHDQGLSFDSLVTPTDIVDLLAEITVDEKHVGARGNIYVLISTANGQVYQLNKSGDFEHWDGSPTNLISVTANDPLKKLERLNLLNGFRFSDTFVGQEFHVYIAYEVSDIGEFVYTTTPLVVKVQAVQ